MRPFSTFFAKLTIFFYPTKQSIKKFNGLRKIPVRDSKITAAEIKKYRSGK